ALHVADMLEDTFRGIRERIVRIEEVVPGGTRRKFDRRGPRSSGRESGNAFSTRSQDSDVLVQTELAADADPEIELQLAIEVREQVVKNRATQGMRDDDRRYAL